MFISIFFIFSFFSYSALQLGSSILEKDREWNKAMPLAVYEYAEPEYIDPVDRLIHILSDPDNLISSSFYIAEGLRDRVIFWAKVFSLYSSSEAIIHDRDNLAIIYDVVKRSELSRERGRIRAILERISRAGGPRGFKARNDREARISKLLASNMSKEQASLAYRNIRAQSGLSNLTKRGIELSSRYISIIEEMFREQGLPWELTRLPFVESSFNVNAVSRLGAGGIWQIMLPIGSRFMETDSVYDERRSPFKATAVAAKLLKENYQILGSWPLAITAYNHGPGGIRRAVRQLKTNDISRIVSEYKHPRFGFASKNFYSEFLAALYVTVYADRLFDNIKRSQVISISYVEMEKAMKIGKLAQISGLSEDSIHYYNPEFSSEIVSGLTAIRSGVSIKLPPRASYRLQDYFVRKADEIRIEERRSIRDDLDVSEFN